MPRERSRHRPAVGELRELGQRGARRLTRLGRLTTAISSMNLSSIRMRTGSSNFPGHLEEQQEDDPSDTSSAQVH
jgi:hypothetical protein